MTNLDTEDFELLVSLGVFNDAIMNEAIGNFKRYEDNSLIILVKICMKGRISDFLIQSLQLMNFMQNNMKIKLRKLLTQNSDLKKTGIYGWTLPAHWVKLSNGKKFNTCPNAGICAAFAMQNQVHSCLKT